MDLLIKFGYDTLGAPKFLAVLLLFFIYIFKVLKSHLDQTHHQRTNRISEMLAEVEKVKSPRWNFTVEQVFQNRFAFLIDYPVINFFLRKESPSSDIYAYIQGFKYIEFSKDYESIKFKKNYSECKLKMYHYVFLAGYALFAFLGLGLIMLLPQIGFESSTNFAVYLTSILFMLIICYLFLDDSVRPISAISLVKKYNQSIERDIASLAPHAGR